MAAILQAINIHGFMKLIISTLTCSVVVPVEEIGAPHRTAPPLLSVIVYF